MSTSRVLAGRVPHRKDSDVQRVLSDLPQSQAQDYHARQTVGIANELAEVYREVDVFGEGELLYLTARLNSLGFGIDNARKLRRYVMVFSYRRNVTVAGG